MNGVNYAALGFPGLTLKYPNSSPPEESVKQNQTIGKMKPTKVVEVKE